jgi:hypothetical protein
MVRVRVRVRAAVCAAVAFGVWTQFMVRVRVRVRAAVCAAVAFGVWTQFTVQPGKRSELPRGVPLVTRMLASSEQACDPMASSSVNFCLKTSTVRENSRPRSIVQVVPSDIGELRHVPSVLCGRVQGWATRVHG